MTTDTPVKRRPGRPSTAETVAKVHARSQAAREHRGRSRKEDLEKSPSPVPKRQFNTDALSLQKRARHLAIQHAVITPDVESVVNYVGGRVAYIVQDGLLHQTNAVRLVPPYRPTNECLYHYGLNDAQITAAFGP